MKSKVLVAALIVASAMAGSGGVAAQIVVCTYNYDCYPGDPHYVAYSPEDRARVAAVEADRAEANRRQEVLEQRQREVQRDIQRAVAQADLEQNLRARARAIEAERRARENAARYGVCPRDRTSSCVSPQ